MRDITELENIKAKLIKTEEAAELAEFKAKLAEAEAKLAQSKAAEREANSAAAAARRNTRAMGARALTVEQLRPAIISGPLRDYRSCSSAELANSSRPWRRLMAMMRAPKHSLARLTAEGLLRQLNVWYEDEGSRREWFHGAAALKEWDKQSTKAPTKQSTDQAATLESGSTTSTGAKVW